MNPEDVFHIIGFTGQDILGGIMFRIMELSSNNLRKMSELHQQFGPLIHAVRAGLLMREAVEIYFLSPFDFDGSGNLRDHYGDGYQSVEFFNDLALRLCEEQRIALPQIIGRTTRAELPQQLGIVMQFPVYLHA